MLKRNISEILAGEQRLFYKMKDIWWEFKEAHRRFWRGYDNSMVWGMNYNLLNLIKRLLIDLKNNHTSYPIIKGEIENDEDYVEIFNRMIFHIKEYQRLEEVDCRNWAVEYYRERQEMKEYHLSEFWRLFIRYYETLWD